MGPDLFCEMFFCLRCFLLQSVSDRLMHFYISTSSFFVPNVLVLTEMIWLCRSEAGVLYACVVCCFMSVQ